MRSCHACRDRQDHGKHRDTADDIGRLEPAVYEASYLNPEYAEETLGAELGGMLSMLYADLLSTIPDLNKKPHRPPAPICHTSPRVSFAVPLRKASHRRPLPHRHMSFFHGVFHHGRSDPVVQPRGLL